MKKKGPRAIPDFSRKAKKASGTGTPETKGQPTPHPAASVAKPVGLPTKSGRRGQ